MGCWTPFSHSHTHSLSHIYTHIHTHTHTHTPSLSALSAHFLSFFLFIFPPLLSPFSFLSFPLSLYLYTCFLPFNINGSSPPISFYLSLFNNLHDVDPWVGRNHNACGSKDLIPSLFHIARMYFRNDTSHLRMQHVCSIDGG